MSLLQTPRPSSTSYSQVSSYLLPDCDSHSSNAQVLERLLTVKGKHRTPGAEQSLSFHKEASSELTILEVQKNFKCLAN